MTTLAVRVLESDGTDALVQAAAEGCGGGCACGVATTGAGPVWRVACNRPVAAGDVVHIDLPGSALSSAVRVFALPLVGAALSGALVGGSGTGAGAGAAIAALVGLIGGAVAAFLLELHAVSGNIDADGRSDG